jgi:hypothetical protein
MATVQPDRIGARFRTSEKNAVQQAFTPSLSVDLHQRLGTYVEQLDYLDGARAVSEGHQG